MEFLKRRIISFLVLIVVSTTILAMEKEFTVIEIVISIFTLAVGIILLIIVSRESQMIDGTI